MRKLFDGKLKKDKWLAALVLAACALVIFASVGPAYSYFSTYATTKGGYKFEDETEITEKVGAGKDIQIRTKKHTSPVYIRLVADAAEMFLPYLDYEADAEEDGSTWVLEDGFWYYTRALSGEDATASLHVELKNMPKAEAESASFNIIVSYEEIAAVKDVGYKEAWAAADARGGEAS